MKPRIAKRIPTTLRLNRRNKPNATFCERCFLLTISTFFYFRLGETASTVKFINKLMKNSTTPSRNNAS